MEESRGRNQFFKTRDLQFSAVLVACGEKLQVVENSGGAALFVFQNSENLPATVEKYLAGEILLEPKNFLIVWKRLRTQLAEALGKGKT